MTKVEDLTNNEPWKWNPKWTEDNNLKEKYRCDPLMCNLLVHDIMMSTQAFAELLEEGHVVIFSAVCLSKDIWDATNFARLWSETNSEEIDTYLQNALSNLADAHYMLESMWGWDKMTPTALASVAGSLRVGLGDLGEANVALNWYIYQLQEGNDGDEGS